MKQGYQGPARQLQLYLGNKSDLPLGRLICAVPPLPTFFLQLGAVPPLIEPKKQARGFAEPCACGEDRPAESGHAARGRLQRQPV